MLSQAAITAPKVAFIYFNCGRAVAPLVYEAWL